MGYNYILLMIKFRLAISLILLPHYLNVLTRIKFLQWCGITSLELYLVHLPLTFHTAMNVQSITVFCLSTVVLPYLFYQAYQKINALKI